jgi:predicted nucleic acid-binding protein
VTLAWCFPDEASPYAASILSRLRDECAIVPSLWFIEVANVLAHSEKRGRIDADESDEFLVTLGEFEIVSDNGAETRAFDHLVTLCRDHSLTSYDATYLDLALRCKLPLATLDQQLRKIAKKLRIALVT